MTRGQDVKSDDGSLDLISDYKPAPLSFTFVNIRQRFNNPNNIQSQFELSRWGHHSHSDTSPRLTSAIGSGWINSHLNLNAHHGYGRVK